MHSYSHYLQAVEAQRPHIFEAHDFLLRHPEFGYREWESSRYLETAYESLGYTVRRAGDIPGFTADFDTGRLGPRILMLAEMDALVCRDHPFANPETGAAHACGHHTENAALLGVAAALKQPGIADSLCGGVRFCAVPAEEITLLEYREQLRREGVVRFYSGKAEFLSRGYFDDCDLCFLIHSSLSPANHFKLGAGNSGCVIKEVIYRGKAAHSGGNPEDGINALYAANIGISACNALRETFVEADLFRWHPIISSGGDAISTIPHDVRMQSMVRGVSFDVIARANRKINRALAASAASIGAQVEIHDRAGAMPNYTDPLFNEIAEKAMGMIVPPEQVLRSRTVKTGGTDMGDLSTVMPTINPSCGGATGHSHGADYLTENVESICVNSAKAQLLMAVLLLENDAEAAKQIVANRKVRFESSRAYTDAMNELMRDIIGVTYEEDGTAVLRY